MTESVEDFKARIDKDFADSERTVRDSAIHMMAVNDFLVHALDFMPNREATLGLMRAYGTYKFSTGLMEKYAHNGQPVKAMVIQ